MTRAAEPTTLLDAFDRMVEARRALAAIRVHDGAAWVERRWGSIAEEADRVALGLSERGVRAGDRVSIMAPSSLPWIVVEVAVFRLGAIVVPIYPTCSDADAEHALVDSGAKVLFVANGELFERVRPMRERTTMLETVVVMSNERVAESVGALGYTALLGEESSSLALRGEIGRAGTELTGKSVAMIMYTSGTTGRPKGVTLLHENLLMTADGLLRSEIVHDDDVPIFFLPLAHCFAQMLVTMWFLRGNPAVMARSIEKVVDDMGETHPTCFAGVPRLFEKVYNKVCADGSVAPGLKGFLFRKTIDALARMAKAKAAGKAFFSLWLLLGRKLVIPKIREKVLARMGGRMRWMASGGAPLSPVVMAFFEACGFSIYEGYGLTECMACATVNAGSDRALGSVGKPIRGCEVRIAEDGEILIRGSNVMAGYWKLPEATRAAIDAEGWLHSGDIGAFGADGRLRITDRKKDIIVTANGKNIAPQNVENAIKASTIVSQVVVYGDRRSYLTALVTVSDEAARNLLLARGEDAAALSYEALSKHPAVRAEVQQAFDRFNAQAGRFETVKRFVVLDHDLTLEGHALTATLKLRRAHVVARYAHLFDAMYGEEAGARGEYSVLSAHPVASRPSS
jgi:long-chain acyl-CoA synthetase